MIKQETIFALYPNVTTISGDIAYDAKGKVIEIDENVVANKIAETEYVFLRKTAYPSVADQLDLIWHMIDQDVAFDKESAFYKAIDAVKTKHPKG